MYVFFAKMSVKIVRKTLEKKFGAKVVARYKSDIKVQRLNKCSDRLLLICL